MVTTGQIKKNVRLLRESPRQWIGVETLGALAAPTEAEVRERLVYEAGWDPAIKPLTRKVTGFNSESWFIGALAAQNHAAEVRCFYQAAAGIGLAHTMIGGLIPPGGPMCTADELLPGPDNDIDIVVLYVRNSKGLLL